MPLLPNNLYNLFGLEIILLCVLQNFLFLFWFLAMLVTRGPRNFPFINIYFLPTLFAAI